MSNTSFSQYNLGARDFNYPTANFQAGIDYSGLDSNGNGYLNYNEIILDPGALSGPNYHLFDDLQTNGKPVLLDFYSPSCHWCRTWSSIVDSVYEVWGPNGSDILNVVGVCSYNTYGYEGFAGLYYFWESTVYDTVHYPLTDHFPNYPQVSDITNDAGVFNVAPYYIESWPRYVVVCPDRTWKFVEGWSANWEGGGYYYGHGEDLSDSIFTAVKGCDPLATESRDAKILAIKDKAIMTCDENYTPEILLQSRGTTPMTSVDIIETVNGTDVSTFHWTGSLNQYEYTSVTLNQVTLLTGQNTLSFRVENPNGGTDENTTNDTLAKDLLVPADPIQITVTYDFAYVSNNDFSWRIEDHYTHDVIYEKSFDNSYTNQVDVQNVCLKNNNCYDFVFVSMSSYGINDIPSKESITVTDNTGSQLVYLDENNAQGPGNYQEFDLVNEFCLGSVNSNETLQEISAKVYPNPGNGDLNIYLDKKDRNLNVKIVDIVGRVVFADKNINNNGNTYNINIENLDNGIYSVILYNNNARKIVKYIKE